MSTPAAVRRATVRPERGKGLPHGELVPGGRTNHRVLRAAWGPQQGGLLSSGKRAMHARAAPVPLKTPDCRGKALASNLGGVYVGFRLAGRAPAIDWFGGASETTTCPLMIDQYGQRQRA
ncbi:hypothetical protein IFM47457_06181 [Aspergillus lentulus]|nr:hypothetical protein IFM47457_06181 [Aspergillus lentulus]